MARRRGLCMECEMYVWHDDHVFNVFILSFVIKFVLEFAANINKEMNVFCVRLHFDVDVINY